MVLTDNQWIEKSVKVNNNIFSIGVGVTKTPLKRSNKKKSPVGEWFTGKANGTGKEIFETCLIQTQGLMTGRGRAKMY